MGDGGKGPLKAPAELDPTMPVKTLPETGKELLRKQRDSGTGLTQGQE